MYDNLIRRDPRDSGQTIIPDLAHSWEIAKDGKTYTFFLRQGVVFHDGAELTADDVKATYDRIVKPPQGVSIPRTPLFATVSEINVRDRHTIEFKLHEPRPTSFIMGAFASGWNIIVRKKTLEDNNYNLRQVMDFPGTGPFKHAKRVDKEVWVQERNPNYWHDGLPYLDGIEFYHFPPFSPELGAALLSGRVDYARLLDPVSLKKVQGTSGMSGTDYYQSVIQAVWVNNTESHLTTLGASRHASGAQQTSACRGGQRSRTHAGGRLYLSLLRVRHPKAKLAERVGYQSDPTAAIKEARQLLAAAGHGDGIKNLDFLVREVNTFKLWPWPFKPCCAKP